MIYVSLRRIVLWISLGPDHPDRLGLGRPGAGGEDGVRRTLGRRHRSPTRAVATAPIATACRSTAVVLYNGGGAAPASPSRAGSIRADGSRSTCRGESRSPTASRLSGSVGGSSWQGTSENSRAGMAQGRWRAEREGRRLLMAHLPSALEQSLRRKPRAVAQAARLRPPRPQQRGPSRPGCRKPRSVPASTRLGSPTTAATRSMRSATTSGCSTKFVRLSICARHQQLIVRERASEQRNRRVARIGEEQHGRRRQPVAVRAGCPRAARRCRAAIEYPSIRAGARGRAADASLMVATTCSTKPTNSRPSACPSR